jgi:hypothetical protein
VPAPERAPVECCQPIQSGSERAFDFMAKYGIRGVIGGGSMAVRSNGTCSASKRLMPDRAALVPRLAASRQGYWVFHGHGRLRCRPPPPQRRSTSIGLDKLSP